MGAIGNSMSVYKHTEPSGILRLLTRGVYRLRLAVKVGIIYDDITIVRVIGGMGRAMRATKGKQSKKGQ